MPAILIKILPNNREKKMIKYWNQFNEREFQMAIQVAIDHADELNAQIDLNKKMPKGLVKHYKEAIKRMLENNTECEFVPCKEKKEKLMPRFNTTKGGLEGSVFRILKMITHCFPNKGLKKGVIVWTSKGAYKDGVLLHKN